MEQFKRPSFTKVISSLLARGTPAQADSLLSETPRKPKNSRVGTLSFLQGIFLTQEIKPGSLALQIDSLPAELPRKSELIIIHHFKENGDNKLGKYKI